MFHRLSHPVVHFTTLAATRRCRCLLRGAFMWVVMPCRLVPCDLRDPGGGDPWFPHGTLLLHSLAGMALWSGCFCLVLLHCHTVGPPVPYWDDTKLSPLASIYRFHPWTGICHIAALFAWVGFLFWVWLGCVLLVLCFCVLVFSFVCFVCWSFVFLCAFLWWHCDRTQDYVSVLHQFTFEATQPQTACVCHN